MSFSLGVPARQVVHAAVPDASCLPVGMNQRHQGVYKKRPRVLTQVRRIHIRIKSDASAIEFVHRICYGNIGRGQSLMQVVKIKNGSRMINVVSVAPAHQRAMVIKQCERQRRYKEQKSDYRSGFSGKMFFENDSSEGCAEHEQRQFVTARPKLPNYQGGKKKESCDEAQRIPQIPAPSFSAVLPEGKSDRDAQQEKMQWIARAYFT